MGIVVVAPAPSATRAVVLVLPGGRARSSLPFRPWQLANLRMIPFAHQIRDQVRGQPVGVWRVHYRVRGWNEPWLDPVQDVRAALAEVRRYHPGARVHLIGHSMGGRAALRCASDRSVIGICAFAPWIEPNEPVEQLAGCSVLIAHGDRDRITDPRMSREYAARASAIGADVAFEVVTGDGHAMVRRAARWNALLRGFVASQVNAPASE